MTRTRSRRSGDSSGSKQMIVWRSNSRLEMKALSLPSVEARWYGVLEEV